MSDARCSPFHAVTAEEFGRAWHAEICARSDSPTWTWEELGDRHRAWKTETAQAVLDRYRLPFPPLPVTPGGNLICGTVITLVRDGEGFQYISCPRDGSP